MAGAEAFSISKTNSIGLLLASQIKPCEVSYVKKTKVAVAGATGYSGQELLKLIKRHSGFEITKLFGREDSLESLKKEADLAFLCTPAEVSLEMAPRLLELGMHVVDVSGAFRLKKFSYSEWYGLAHGQSRLLQSANYGLYPWNKLKASAEPQLIANPGCFATAVLMGLIPLFRSGLVKTDPLFIDAKSGTTGAGRKAETRLLFSEIEGEFAPYRVGRHQHWPEIVEAVENFAKISVKPCFVTELLPTARGISVAIFAEWVNGSNLPKLLAAFQEAYAAETDVSVGVEPSLLSMKSVVNTNRVHIHVSDSYGKALLFVNIDNLLRGAAGQAMLNANQLMGYDLREGVWE